MGLVAAVADDQGRRGGDEDEEGPAREEVEDGLVVEVGGDPAGGPAGGEEVEGGVGGGEGGLGVCGRGLVGGAAVVGGRRRGGGEARGGAVEVELLEAVVIDEVLGHSLLAGAEC